MQRKPLLTALSVLVVIVLALAGVVVYEVVFKGMPEGANYTAKVKSVERNPDGTLTVHVVLTRGSSGTFSKVTVSKVRVLQKVPKDEKMAKVWQDTATIDTKPPDTPAPQTLELAFTGGPYPEEWKAFHLFFAVEYTVKSGILGMVGQAHDFGEEHSVDVKIPRF
jgi:hypothetical protein